MGNYKQFPKHLQEGPQMGSFALHGIISSSSGLSQLVVHDLGFQAGGPPKWHEAKRLKAVAESNHSHTGLPSARKITKVAKDHPYNAIEKNSKITTSLSIQV
jgi:hypothetical protein